MKRTILPVMDAGGRDSVRSFPPSRLYRSGVRSFPRANWTRFDSQSTCLALLCVVNSPFGTVHICLCPGNSPMVFGFGEA